MFREDNLDAIDDVEIAIIVHFHHVPRLVEPLLVKRAVVDV